LVNISGAETTYLSAGPVLLITLVNISGVRTTYLSAAPVLLIILVNISGESVKQVQQKGK
jgi:peptidoglycan hydrolase-like protein with peptidoglycan-binding domain